MKRTWFQCTSDGTYFRNKSCVEQDLRRWPNRLLPHHRARLRAELEILWRKGTIEQAAIPAGDRVFPFDDSPEATLQWANAILQEKARRTS